MGYISVIGSVNSDIIAVTGGDAVLHDSNPGRVSVHIGGVGCNIARATALMGYETHFFTVFGGDTFSASAKQQLSAIPHMDISHSETFSDEASSVYVCVHGHDGDLVAGVSDMKITERINESYVEERLVELNGSDAVMIDCNLSEAVLSYITENVKAPLIADTVSTKKALRIKKFLARLTAIKPNLIEAEALTGTSSRVTMLDFFRAYPRLRAYISLGAEGVMYSSGERNNTVPPYPCIIKNTNGCGDAMTAAIAVAICKGMNADDTARYALAVSAAAASSGSIDLLNEETIKRYLNKGDV